MAVASRWKILLRLLAVSSLVAPVALAAAITSASATGVNMYISPNPPDGTVGQPYSYQLNVVGGTPPYTFMFRTGTPGPGYVAGPPAGISISSSGLMTGTPEVVEQTEWQYEIVDSTGYYGGYGDLTMTVGTGNSTLDPVLVPADTSLLVTANQVAVLGQQVVGTVEAVASYVECVAQDLSTKYCGL